MMRSACPKRADHKSNSEAVLLLNRRVNLLELLDQNYSKNFLEFSFNRVSRKSSVWRALMSVRVFCCVTYCQAAAGCMAEVSPRNKAECRFISKKVGRNELGEYISHSLLSSYIFKGINSTTINLVRCNFAHQHL